MRTQRNILLALGRYDHRIHRGIARYAGRLNWHLNCDMCVSGALPMGWVGDGIITLLTARKDLLRFIRLAKVPVVDLSLIRDDIPLPRVLGDHQTIGQLAAEHFLERGFRHFAWCASDTHPLWELRRVGFAETLRKSGFSCESWIWKPGKALANSWQSKSRWLAAKLRMIKKPVAVFAFNDYEAANVLDGCAEAGLAVPEEVAILGVDNNELICDCVRVPLSSIRHDLERLGYEGAALLDRLMRGRGKPRAPLLIAPGGIEVRRSSDVLAVNHEPCRLALKYIHENLARNIGVDDIALASGVPRRSLEHAFRKQLGRSVQEEISRRRVAKVKELLLQTELPVADIAALCGFNTPQYLNLVFRRAVGTTPRKFRVARRLPA